MPGRPSGSVPAQIVLSSRALAGATLAATFEAGAGVVLAARSCTNSTTAQVRRMADALVANRLTDGTPAAFACLLCRATSSPLVIWFSSVSVVMSLLLFGWLCVSHLW